MAVPLYVWASNRSRRRRLLAWGGGCLLGWAVLAGPARADQRLAQLADLSLEQLREVVVTTVSRVEERQDRAAAAVYVISGDDIRRAGATTLPEALRLAPMLNIARADANQYAISARGFNNVLANKMLVLVDGRTVYSPLFSGVFWEAQDVMLEDVERIEVVTGPSTALWGSNAVNGLIHVITRAAADTQGTALSAEAGNRQRGAAVRQGFALGGDGPDAPVAHLRVYGKSYDRSDTHRANGSSVYDHSNGVQAGFRADWRQPDQTLTLQGDAYEGRVTQGIASARRFSGVNLLARWARVLAGGANANVQAYVEQTRRNHPFTFGETLTTADVVAQYGFKPLPGHQALVGAGWRHAQDDVTQYAALGFMPPSRTLVWSRVFAQDQVALPHNLALTLSTSVESNPYTGAEVLPSLRLAWQASERALWWGAVSRAVRAPSRIDREYVQPGQPPYLVNGGPTFESEVSNVFELGHRAQVSPALAYSATAFHHQHSRLRSLAPTPVGLQFQNGYEGWTRGVEAWARWRPVERWRLDAGANWLQTRLQLRPGALDVGGPQALGNDPKQGWSLRSSLDVTPRHAWELAVRHVGALPQPAVPAYTAVDTRWAWRVSPEAELALQLQNLFDPRHAEWGVATNRVELERAVRVQLRWRL